MQLLPPLQSALQLPLVLQRSLPQLLPLQMTRLAWQLLEQRELQARPAQLEPQVPPREPQGD